MARQAQDAQSTATFVVLLAGPLIWAAHFFLLYAGATFICANTGGAPGDRVWWMALAATLVSVAALAALIVRPPLNDEFPGAAFVRNAARLLSLLALLAVVWAGAAALLLPACV